MHIIKMHVDVYEMGGCYKADKDVERLNLKMQKYKCYGQVGGVGGALW